MKSKRGISPIISTILLISIVIVLALIILIWARGFWSEAVEKQGRSAEQVCQEVNLQAVYLSGGDIQVTNIGNVPIFKLEAKKQGSLSTDVENIQETLEIGQSVTINIANYDDYDSVELIPQILGQAGSAKQIYTCVNNGFYVE